jgi:hypothetical protein
LDRGHDSIVEKNMAASVINVTLAHSARSLAMIDMIGFTPAGGNDLLGRHADPGIAAASALRFLFFTTHAQAANA